MVPRIEVRHDVQQEAAENDWQVTEA